MFNCRGPENRVRLLEKYNVKPISHTKLLKGQVKRSCAKEMLTDEYYIFTYHAKNNINESGTFVCGTHVARHFLELLHLEPLPLFNPLKGNNENVDLNDNLNGNSGGGNIVWDPLAKELYNAINLLIVCWDKALYGTLLRIKEELERYPTSTPFEWKVESINSVISRDYRKRKLIQMIEELKKDNENLKTYTFEHVTEVLNKKGIESYFV